MNAATATTLIVLGGCGLGSIAAAVAIEVRAHLARRDRISPIIRSRVAGRVQRRGTAL